MNPLALQPTHSTPTFLSHVAFPEYACHETREDLLKLFRIFKMIGYQPCDDELHPQYTLRVFAGSGSRSAR